MEPTSRQSRLSGSGWESNPPRPATRPATGFEDQEARRDFTTPAGKHNRGDRAWQVHQSQIPRGGRGMCDGNVRRTQAGTGSLHGANDTSDCSSADFASQRIYSSAENLSWPRGSRSIRGSCDSWYCCSWRDTRRQKKLWVRSRWALLLSGGCPRRTDGRCLCVGGGLILRWGGLLNREVPEGRKASGDSWSGREDLNLRPLAPHASALAGLRHAPTP